MDVNTWLALRTGEERLLVCKAWGLCIFLMYQKLTEERASLIMQRHAQILLRVTKITAIF